MKIAAYTTSTARKRLGRVRLSMRSTSGERTYENAHAAPKMTSTSAIRPSPSQRIANTWSPKYTTSRPPRMRRSCRSRGLSFTRRMLPVLVLASAGAPEHLAHRAVSRPSAGDAQDPATDAGRGRHAARARARARARDRHRRDLAEGRGREPDRLVHRSPDGPRRPA